MSKPARLNKVQTDKDFSKFLLDKIEAWANAHAFFCLTLLFVALLILFVALCFAIVGTSATDSGTVYNHFQGII